MKKLKNEYVIIINESKYAALLSSVLLMASQAIFITFSIYFDSPAWTFVAIVLFMIMFWAQINSTNVIRVGDEKQLKKWCNEHLSDE